MLKRFLEQYTALSFRERLLLALVFVLPLERIPSFDVAGLTVKLSILVGTLLVGLEAPRLLRSFKFKEFRKSFVIAPLLFFAFSLLSLIWSESTTFGLKSNLILGFNVAAFYAVYSVVRNCRGRTYLNLTYKTLIVSALLVIGFGFWQWFGDLLGLSSNFTGIREEYTAERLGLPRMHSTLLEPLYFGLYLLLPLGLLWADRTGKFIKSIYSRFGIITLIYMAILLSLARGAIVASVFIGLIGLAYNFTELKERLKLKDLAKLALGGVLALVLLVGLTSVIGKQGTDEDHLYEKGFSTIVGHLETIKPWGSKEDEADQNSINSRDEAREDAWVVVESSPENILVGVGAGQHGLSLVPEKGFEATSNFMLLDVWVEYGLVGLLMIIFFLGAILRNSFSRSYLKKLSLSEHEKVFVIGIGIYLLGFLIQSITFGELTITHLWVVSALATSLVVCYSSESVE
ncbi:MAG: hypothetical protein QG623_238 [Patescibacteria group bacterium]|nr:hypothetical protein [Patescibacteria group bacterium]